MGTGTGKGTGLWGRVLGAGLLDSAVMRACGVWAVLAASFLGLGGCGDEADPVETYAEAGGGGVGFTRRTVAYERPDGEGTRELETLFWYPTEATEGDPPRYTFGFSERALVDAPPAAGPFPTIVFSHGHQGLPDAHTFLMEHFASHGWLVIAPTHTGNTTADGNNRVASIYYLRPWDVSRTLDFALELGADDPLAGLSGTPRVVSGHSFGGYTAYAIAGAAYDVGAIEAGCAGDWTSPVCDELDEEALGYFEAGFHDARFDALISMAAGDARLFGDGAGAAAIEVPVFQMVAEGDGHPPGSAGEDEYWVALDGASDLRLDLLGGAHNSFSDVCASLPRFTGCPEENDAEVDQRHVRLYALAFAEARVLGEDAAERVLEEPVVDPATLEMDRK